MPYCIYLRKSRADAEAEEHGEGETLVRHEKTLIELAKSMTLNITQIYREIVSGETIASRPVMQQLLQEVEQGLWEGVLVMEVERLARGDTIDQGIVSQTFKYSNTKIITPLKTYNPDNEFDEEYFEFGLFMSRREYKMINRRLQRGRIASVKEGKYAANKSPYGYERVRIKNDKGWTLSIIDEQAEIVRLIFEWYTVGEKQSDGSYKRLGTSLIARRLNSMKVPTKTGGDWVVSTIRDIIANPVYIGKIRWNWRHNVKKIINGKVTVSRPRSNDSIICKGLHSPIISEDTFNLAQEYLHKNPPLPINEHNTVKNPLSGIVLCGKCGRCMVRRPNSNRAYPDTLMCPSTSCNNVSSNLNIVEQRILQSLENWLGQYKLEWNSNSNKSKASYQIEIRRKALNKLKTELETLNKQLNKTHDLLEQNIYDNDTFLRRSSLLGGKIEQTKNSINAIVQELKIENDDEDIANIIPKAKKIIDVYNELPTAQGKNDLLKEIIKKVIYVKDTEARRKSPDNFKLIIYPKLNKYSDIEQDLSAL